ncbi:MAG: phosphodiester glycosidase family protein [Cyanobacteria bacterium REEB459]|nr:phosphodiester glycosidase family protein [Cyanobacteria bacterium REEB459]
MARLTLIRLCLPLLALSLGGCAAFRPDHPTARADSTALPPTYEQLSWPGASVHLITIPDPVTYPLRVGVAQTLAPVNQTLAHLCGAQFCGMVALNAGFFDPHNGLTTAAVVVGGALVADPRQNPRLMTNPDLAGSLDKILNRSEFRRYDCHGRPAYAITPHRQPLPLGCSLVDAVAAGPQLLPNNTEVIEGFFDTGLTPPRDALGSRRANARSAVGIRADGSLLLVMVAQVPGLASSGMTLAQLADLMAQQGAVQALNLDGGSSSTLVYGPTTYYGRLDSLGQPQQRSVKSILWVANPQLALPSTPKKKDP